MFAISKREFLRLIKGVKSIIIIAILLITAYYSAKFSGLLLTLADFSASEAESIQTAGLLVLMLFFGQLFVMGLSHDVINRETHDRTIRFLVTRTSRLSIVMGKFLGVFLFWLVCISASFLIIFFFSNKVDWVSFLQLMSLLVYQISFTILLSVLVPKPGFTMFLSIIVGLSFPVAGFWLTLTNNSWFSWLKFTTPFYYLQEDHTFPIILVLSALLLSAAHLLFKRREC
ncbi:ABC transporter permease subunit [Jeotgalibacillus haloalkalitolerans]|uniref:ABC transporter permease subunit n=1 Tax=Jeotgalibacillus haloalkalitolerans TaxID=3104292 RepID=A0ABU5KN32_9BACL|nr:ABC transporter permease subunit [Jeotgalibacillus sp. HH7-29]MDZ5712672.1 ABC transporter permease subunit [Jeotgalibacillus sp. HH7-29]